MEWEGPGHRVGERFAKLIPSEGTISNTLLVPADAFDGKDFLLFGQKSSIHLAIRHDEEDYLPIVTVNKPMATNMTFQPEIADQ